MRLSIAGLKRRLVPGTKLTLVSTTSRGIVNGRRTVKRVATRDILMIEEDGPQPGRTSYLNLAVGTTVDETPSGFIVTMRDREGDVIGHLVYDFGWNQPPTKESNQ